MDQVTSDPPATGLFDNYQPIAGVYDEMFDASGAARPHCQRVIEQLNRGTEADLDRAQRHARQLLRENGVSFNAFDESGESTRPWQLDILPAVLAARDFSRLSEGLIQRGRLLSLLLDDLFGEQLLLKEKVLPPGVVFGHPGFHRAYHNLLPPGHRRITLYAADVARSPDGRWWVTGDRTRSPSGLGFAVENRVVTGRVQQQAFRSARVMRLAPFFQRLRETLRESAPRQRENPRIVLLSRGPDSPSYFEDVYLARYLGYTLAEGGDLAVRNDRVMVKTLVGLLPVEVLLRRVSDGDCDPVELNSLSLTGVSGLVDVVRGGHVAVANSLGCALAETPALIPFLRSACRFLLDEDLKLPSLATWWCGEEASLSYVREHLDDLVLRPAWRARADSARIEPGRLSAVEREDLIQRLEACPADFVAQERIVRSTVPAWQGSKVEPWHAAFRLFLAADGDSFETLPGGLARVSPNPASLDRSMTAGDLAQDVWIESPRPVDPISLLPGPEASITITRGGDDLSSRDADNIFWLGRMVERGDCAARATRVLIHQVLNGEGTGLEAEQRPLLRALAALGQVEPGLAVDGLDAGLPSLEVSLPLALFNTQEPRSLRSTVREMVRLADSVRDRLSADAWRSLSILTDDWQPEPNLTHLDMSELLRMVQRVIDSAAMFGGLASESTTRNPIWRFLELGRRLERAWSAATLLQTLLTVPGENEGPILEAVLIASDSIMTYRSRYLATLRADAVIDLLLTDETNPRSILFQIEKVHDHVTNLPFAGQAMLGPDERLAISMHNAVRLADPLELARVADGQRKALDRLLQRLTDQIPKLSDAVNQRYLIHAGLPRQFGQE
jgi:uncharacterized circularly permuted ATP-grasp superfamily protein/uncharacterized alpha-E superfamily protein